MSRVWLFGDDVNTDEIIPGRYNVTTNPQDLAKYVLCEIRPELPKMVQQGDIIVAGRNFGCGSSREHAPVAIKAVGISCVVAKSFARIFYRNAINIGLIILECPELERIGDGDTITVHPTTGKIITETNVFQANPLPDFIMQIIDAGGIVSFLQRNSLADLQI
jgi:3-isopropylmalate/(R)-2-methylmalate dehydratase small subunit